MSWNHRMLAHQLKDEIVFKIHEVYYDENNNPKLYTKDPVSISEGSLEDVHITLIRMQACMWEPVLWYGDKFPQEYPTRKQKSNEEDRNDNCSNT